MDERQLDARPSLPKLAPAPLPAQPKVERRRPDISRRHGGQVLTLDAKTLEMRPERPKRKLTDQQAQAARRLRVSGGACENCRLAKKKCPHRELPTSENDMKDCRESGSCLDPSLSHVATVAEAREESVIRDETRQEQSQDSADGPSTKSNDDTGESNAQARDETWIDKYNCFLSSTERSTEAMPPDKSLALDSQVMLWSEDPFEWSPETMASHFPNSGNTKGTYDLWPGASFSQGQFSTSHHWLQSDRYQGHMMHGNRQVLRSGDDLAESHIDPNVLKLPSSEARSTDMNNPGLPSDNSAVDPYLSSKSCKSFIPHLSVAGEPSHSRAPSPYKGWLRSYGLISESITIHLPELQSSSSSGTAQTDRRAIDEARRIPARFRCDHEGCSFSSQTAQDLRFAMRQTLSPELWSLMRNADATAAFIVPGFMCVRIANRGSSTPRISGGMRRRII